LSLFPYTLLYRIRLGHIFITVSSSPPQTARLLARPEITSSLRSRSRRRAAPSYRRVDAPHARSMSGDVEKDEAIKNRGLPFVDDRIPSPRSAFLHGWCEVTHEKRCGHLSGADERSDSSEQADCDEQTADQLDPSCDD